MCIPYNDIEYHHGIRAAKPIGSDLRYFDVMVTKHTENQPYRYSGICLNNGYEVCTSECMKPTALVVLLEKIVGDTLASEKEYTVRYPGETYKPLVNIKNKAPDIYENFFTEMKSGRSLEEYYNIYKNLRPLMEKPRFDPSSSKDNSIESSSTLKEKIVPFHTEVAWEILVDCKDMYLFSLFAKRNEILKDCEIKYVRV